MSRDRFADHRQMMELTYAGLSRAKTIYLSKTERSEFPEEQQEIYPVGSEKAKALTYAELSLENLDSIFTLLREFGGLGPPKQKEGDEAPPPEDGPSGVFVDCGSGIGKQVFHAATLHKFTKSVGIEVLAALDEQAQAAAAKFAGLQNDGIPPPEGAEEGTEPTPWPEALPKTEVACVKADFVDEVANHLTDESAVILAVATCYDDELMERLLASLQKAPMDSFLVTVTKTCPDVDFWEPIHIEQMAFPWGESTLLIHRKIKMPEEEE